MKLKMFTFAFVTALCFTANAGQIKPENGAWPKCYVGDPETAFEELMNGDYDPVFSRELSWREGHLITGIQKDENGDELATFLEPCD